MFSRRLIQFAVIATIATVLLPAASYAGKGGGTAPTCTPIPVRMTIMPIEGSVLAADRDAAYINATDGVFANIGICDGTYDLRIRLSDSSRMVSFTLPGALENTFGKPPAWAGGEPFDSKPWLTVFNLLWGRMNGKPIFTTRAMVSHVKGPDDPATYDLRLQAPTADATPAPPLRADINTPYDTSVVMVEDVLGNCRTVSDPQLVTLDSWIVTVNTGSIGTLFNQGYQKTRYSPAGQYKVSFKLHIQALTCVPSSLTPMY